MDTTTYVEQFDRDGYVIGPQLLEGAKLEAARAAVDRILNGTCERADELLLYRRERPDDPNSQVHVIGAWLAEDALRELVTDPTIIKLVCGMLKTDAVRIFRDQLFIKAPLSEGTVPWHQDYSDWTHTAPVSHVTCWIALDEATPDNGCLRYLPGSQHTPLLPKIGRGDDMDAAFARLPEELRANFAPEPAPVPAGGCVFHHAMIVHGSYGNSENRPRRAFAVTYMHPETRSASADRPIVPKGPVVPVGEIIDDRLFPVLRG